MDPFVAEIRIVGFNFAPSGWAQCNGQLLPISQNTALFSLLGTFYGGNGQSTFALPDLQGRAPVQPGQGPGLSIRDLGESSGVEFITLLSSEIPAHSHNIGATTLPGDVNLPTGNILARSSNVSAYNANNTPLVQLSPLAITPTGSSLPHNNLQPYLTINFIIALQGVFPQHP